MKQVEVGIKGLLWDGSLARPRYLLLLRDEAFEGEKEPRWDILGGLVDLGKDRTPTQTLVREAEEELPGVEIVTEGPEAPIPLMGQIITRANGSEVNRLTSLGRISSLDDTVSLGDEHQAHGLYTRRGALGLNVDPYLRVPLSDPRLDNPAQLFRTYAARPRSSFLMAAVK
jgi:hypothetical protein